MKMFELISEKEKNEARTLKEWQDLLDHPSIIPHLRAILSNDMVGSFDLLYTNQNILQLKPVIMSLEWVRLIERLLLDNRLPPLSKEILVRCYNSDLDIDQVIKSHLQTVRENEFAEEILKFPEDGSSSITIAKNGLKPAVLDWILIEHGILNPANENSADIPSIDPIERL
jgi:hypothetical protein